MLFSTTMYYHCYCCCLLHKYSFTANTLSSLIEDCEPFPIRKKYLVF